MSKCICGPHNQHNQLRFRAILLPSVLLVNHTMHCHSHLSVKAWESLSEEITPNRTFYCFVWICKTSPTTRRIVCYEWFTPSQAINPSPSVPVKVWKCAFLRERDIEEWKGGEGEATPTEQNQQHYKVDLSQKQWSAARGPVRFELYDVRKTKICAQLDWEKSTKLWGTSIDFSHPILAGLSCRVRNSWKGFAVKLGTWAW